jgi:hypothetical protein
MCASDDSWTPLFYHMQIALVLPRYSRNYVFPRTASVPPLTTVACGITEENALESPSL